MIVTTKYCDCVDAKTKDADKHTMPLETPQIVVGGFPLDVCDNCGETVTVAQLRLMATAKAETMANRGTTRHV